MYKAGDRYYSEEREEMVVIITPLVKDRTNLGCKGKDFVHYAILPSNGEQYICEIDEFSSLYTKMEYKKGILSKSLDYCGKAVITPKEVPQGHIICALKDGCTEDATQLYIFGPYATYEEARLDSNAYCAQPHISEDYYGTEIFIKSFQIPDGTNLEDYTVAIASYVKNEYPMSICGNPNIVGVYSNREEAEAMYSCIGNKRSELDEGTHVIEIINIEKININK